MLALTRRFCGVFNGYSPEDSRGLCHALCVIAAVTLFFSKAEQFLDTLDITTVISTVILLRAFYDVTGTYAHPIELFAGWIAVISVGCALFQRLARARSHHDRLHSLALRRNLCNTGRRWTDNYDFPILIIERTESESGCAYCCDQSLHSGFSVFDLFSVLTALGIDLTEREAKQPGGAIISFACCGSRGVCSQCSRLKPLQACLVQRPHDRLREGYHQLFFSRLQDKGEKASRCRVVSASPADLPIAHCRHGYCHLAPSR